MKEITVTLVSDECGEWAGLYIDGILECEGHSVYEKDWIDLIKKYKHFKQIDKFTIDNRYLEDLGSLPFKFTEIPNNVLR